MWLIFVELFHFQLFMCIYNSHPAGSFHVCDFPHNTTISIYCVDSNGFLIFWLLMSMLILWINQHFFKQCSKILNSNNDNLNILFELKFKELNLENILKCRKRFRMTPYIIARSELCLKLIRALACFIGVTCI